MNIKVLSKIYLSIMVVLNIIFTFIIYFLIYNIFPVFITTNLFLSIFECFLLSYCISNLLLKSLLFVFERYYIKSNEIKYDGEQFDYYRDIINNYSIGVISYCYGKTFNYKDIVVAVILKLKMDKKVVINGDKIDVLSEDNLSILETMVVKTLKGWPNVYTKKNIKKQIKEDVQTEFSKCDLCLKVNDSQDITLMSDRVELFLWLINFAVLFFLQVIVESNTDGINLVYLLVLFSFHFICLGFIIVTGNTNKLLLKTDKGIELQRKLLGLSNFLMDFTEIKNSEIKEIELRDYYIIYGILFNQKGSLDKESSDFYQKYFVSLIK